MPSTTSLSLIGIKMFEPGKHRCFFFVFRLLFLSRFLDLALFSSEPLSSSSGEYLSSWSGSREPFLKNSSRSSLTVKVSLTRSLAS